MTVPVARSLAVVIVASAVVSAGAALTGVVLTAQAPEVTAPVVYVAEVDSIIHPVSAEYMTGTLAEADRANAALVVFTLRTPGGLVDSTRDIVSGMIAATTPVVMFVTPSGSRAASAGFLLMLAADVAAMAPGTHIGAAHPVAGGGEQMSETMAKKAEEDVAAYARTLASARRRNVELATDAVRSSRAFTETEAANASPPLIDLIASDVPELLTKLDGRTVRRFDGGTVVLRTAGARVVPVAMTLRQRVLSAIAHPNIAYLLLSLGMLGLTIELWSPGAILPGVVGGVSLLLAFFALQLLPVNFAGLLLILLGLLLLALEIKVTSFGLLTAGGLVSLLFGSMILMDSGVPELQVSSRVVFPVVFGFGGIGILLARLGLTSQRRAAVTGVAGLVGQTARTLTVIEPDLPGRVRVHGENWQATAAETIPEGARVQVTNIEGLTLVVRKD
jgi:membrane-bound serine protease (ClpP class)